MRQNQRPKPSQELAAQVGPETRAESAEAKAPVGLPLRDAAVPVASGSLVLLREQMEQEFGRGHAVGR
jgi:hypothetical protein